MFGQIIRIEQDGGAVRIFEALFRLKSTTQQIAVDKSYFESFHHVIHICLKIILSFLFHQLNGNLILIIHQIILLIFPGFGAVDISVAVYPYGKV